MLLCHESPARPSRDDSIFYFCPKAIAPTVHVYFPLVPRQVQRLGGGEGMKHICPRFERERHENSPYRAYRGQI